jgi:hypothetical protein
LKLSLCEIFITPLPSLPDLCNLAKYSGLFN